MILKLHAHNGNVYLSKHPSFYSKRLILMFVKSIAWFDEMSTLYHYRT